MFKTKSASVGRPHKPKNRFRNGLLFVLAVIVIACGLIAYVSVRSLQPTAIAASDASSAGPALPRSVSAQSSTTSVPLSHLRRSVVMIEIKWSGTVTVSPSPAAAPSGPVTGKGGLSVSYAQTVDAESTARCTAWFAGTGSSVGFDSSTNPVLVTASHCVSDKNVEDALRQDAYDKLNGLSESAVNPAQWTVSLDSGPVVKIVPTLDWLVASHNRQQGTRLTLLDAQTPDTGDLAILQSDQPLTGYTPLAVASGTPKDGQRSVSVGYPGSVNRAVEDAYLKASLKTGTVSSTQVSDDGNPVTEVSESMSGGMSGGPTVDTHGNVIGINDFGVDQQAFNFITDTAALRRYLKKHDVDTPKPKTHTLQTEN